ncbi:O-GlcNAc transferase [Bacteroidota bacterium]|nr:O-GlcNAc transferase [Bacteroidota bacterium]
MKQPLKKKEKQESKPQSKKSPVEKSVNKNLKWVLLAAVLLLTLLIYYPSLKNDWTNWDDRGYVLDNDLTKNLSVNTFLDFFTKPQVMGNYHPLPMLSLAIDWKMYGDDAKGYHFTALLYHLLNTVLVFFFILLLMESVWMATIVSAFFAIHPAHTESVAWIAERKDLMYVCFYLISLIAYLFYSKSKSALSYSLCIFTFILSLLSKGQAVTLPIVLLGIDYLKNRNWNWKVLLEKIPFFILSIAFGLLAVKAQSLSKSIADIPYYSFPEKMLFAAYSLLSYFYKAVYANPLSAFYPYPLKGAGYSWLIWSSPILLLIIAAIVFFKFRKNRMVIFGLGFFLVNVALILQILPVGAAIMADRYTYLAYLGLFFLIAYLFDRVMKNKSIKNSYKQLVSVFIIAIIAVQCSNAMDRIAVWKNSESLWLDTIKKYEYVPVAHNNLGSYYQKNNRLDEALVQFNEGIRLQKNYPEALINRSDIFRIQGKIREAIDDCSNAIKFNPGYPGAYMNRGIAYSIGGKYDSAFHDFKMVLKTEPNNANAYGNLGNLLDMKGQVDSAIWAYTKAIEINPAYFDCYGNRARSYIKNKMYNEALTDANSAIQYSPSAGNLYALRADVYFNMNQLENALSDALKAQQLGFSVNQQYIEMLKQKTGK